MLSHKIIFLILGIIILAVVIYLNRSYAQIYSYNQSSYLITSDIQRTYLLEGGKGERSMKYVALGDSLTYGLGASSYQGTFPYALSQKLLNKYKSVEVINLAVSGAVVDDLLSDQLPPAIKEQPDFVTILIGTNDVHGFADEQKFRSSLEYIINQLKKNTKAEILLINIPYLGSDDLILFPHDKIVDSKITEFNQMIQEVANLTDVKYFDLYNSAKDYFEKDSELYSSDQFHPSDKGYILWGNLINAD